MSHNVPVKENLIREYVHLVRSLHTVISGYFKLSK